MNNATVRKRTQITIGLDLGDRRHTYYVLDGAGKMAREGSLGHTREQLATMARSYPGATVVMEAGTCSTRSKAAAATMFSSEALTSFQPRVFSPQSGFTHRFSTGSTAIAFRRRSNISPTSGTRGEWMSQ